MHFLRPLVAAVIITGMANPDSSHTLANSFPAHMMTLYAVPVSTLWSTVCRQWSIPDDGSSLQLAFVTAYSCVSILLSWPSAACLLTLVGELLAVRRSDGADGLLTWIDSIVMSYPPTGRSSCLSMVHERVMLPSVNVVAPSLGWLGVPEILTTVQ